MEKRIEWLDFAKGFAIVLVVFGHAVEYIFPENTGNSIVHMIIYSFHMPFFFMLSGIVFFDNKYSSFKKFFKKKFCTLIIPSYIFLIIPLLIGHIKSVMNWGESVPINKKSVIRTILQFRIETIANYWFLPTLFWALIIMWCVHKAFKSNTHRVIVSIFLATIGAAYICIVAKPLPFSIDNAILVYVFMEIGYQIKDKLTKINGKYNIVIVVLALIWIVSAVVNYKYFGHQSISLAYVTLLNPVLFFVSAISGSIFCILLCDKIENAPGINCWGKNTLVIYLLSGSILSPFTGWLNKYDIKNGFLSLVICFIISLVVVEITNIISIMIKSYCPYILGMKKIRRT